VPPNTKQKVFGASDYPSTLANSTLILLFSKMLKFSKNYLFQIKRYCEVKIMIFRNIPFIEMNFSYLIN
jgi:ABC-type amino acid transport system permease subunit